MKRLTCLVPLLLLLVFIPPARAAFIIKPTVLVGSATVPAITYQTAERTIATGNKTKEEKTDSKIRRHRYEVASFLIGIAGLATGILAIILLSTAATAAIILFILTILLGLMAIRYAIKDIKGLFPKNRLALAGMILGMIEAAPFTILAALVLACTRPTTKKLTKKK